QRAKAGGQRVPTGRGGDRRTSRVTARPTGAGCGRPMPSRLEEPARLAVPAAAPVRRYAADSESDQGHGRLLRWGSPGTRRYVVNGVARRRHAGTERAVRLDGRMLVGLTGGIGAGKSVVATRLAELGAVVIDSDRLAREVVAPGTDGLAEVVAAFGDD